ncbi:MAG: histidinol dehydrogenase [Opitutaceae bacterium]|jgi:histidinol dehydrogenase|nr:histidinol dehydrogenase [Opitutaceae bacterium]
MRLLDSSDKNFAASLADFCRAAAPSPEIRKTVADILADIRERGDEAVAYYAAKFDAAKLRAREFRLRPDEIAAAAARVPAARKKAIAEARDALLAFHRRHLPKDWTASNPHGASVGEIFRPIRRVALYIPGGQAPLVSTVLHTAVLAQIAGCPEIALFSPSNPRGALPDEILAAAKLLGLQEIYRVGGVQAIGAAAYGTLTIPAADKIVGPGNAYVCEAKRQVFGTVGIDSLPGPSELMLVCDETADPACAAADLLAQAEHGSGREKIYLLATSPTTLNAVNDQLRRQLAGLARDDKIRRVLDEGFLAIRAASLDEAPSIVNAIAPEHLQLLVRDAALKPLLRDIRAAGAIFIGNNTPTVLGDFTAGPSHVLPTGRAARFSSGLRVSDFLLRASVTRYTKPQLAKALPVTTAFGQMEHLDAHARSAQIRLEKTSAKNHPAAPL